MDGTLYKHEVEELLTFYFASYPSGTSDITTNFRKSLRSIALANDEIFDTYYVNAYEI